MDASARQRTAAHWMTCGPGDPARSIERVLISLPSPVERHRLAEALVRWLGAKVVWTPKRPKICNFWGGVPPSHDMSKVLKKWILDKGALGFKSATYGRVGHSLFTTS